MLVALTPHGYGHAAMTAPIVNLLCETRPDLRVTLQTRTERGWLESRYRHPFELVEETVDFGLAMHSATLVDVDASARAYLDLHARLDEVVDREAERLRRLCVDLVLANIPYVTLLAARQAGIPSIAVSCLNWADLHRRLLGHTDGAAAVEAEMQEGYDSALMFLKPAPAMAMDDLKRPVAIGPLAGQGTLQKEALRALTGAGPGERIGLVAFGGMASGLDFKDWPSLPGWRWIATEAAPARSDIVPRHDLPLDFTDILRSADVVIGKPGYGTVAEIGVNGTPIILQPRPDWPETPYLAEWLGRHGRLVWADIAEMLDPVRLELKLRTLFSLPAKPLAQPTGAEDAVRHILPHLG